MSDIFISYKREEQPTARKLAAALEKEGWSVWWDPQLRAGEHFDDVIEKALNEAKCVIVMWSERSVQSRYVRDEATYALEKNKLVPVAVENVSLPLRFRGVHTLSLLGWDGSKDFSEFRRLVDDISAILGRSPTAKVAQAQERRKLEERQQEEAKRKADEEKERNRAQQEAEQRRVEAEAQRKTEEERLQRQERQRFEEHARRKAEEANRRLIGTRPAVSNLGLRAGQVMCGLAIALLFNVGFIFDLKNNQPWWAGYFAVFVIALLAFGALLWTENRAAVSDLDLERVAGQVMCVLAVAVFGIVVIVFDLENTKPWWEKYFQGFVVSLLAFGALLWTMSRKKST